jgi:hypothetical protein
MEKLCLQHIEMWNLLVMATTLCKCNNCQYDHPASNVKACMSEWEQVASSFAHIQIMNIMKRKLWHPCNHSWKRSDIRVQTYVPNSLHHAHTIMNQMTCPQKPSTIPRILLFNCSWESSYVFLGSMCLPNTIQLYQSKVHRCQCIWMCIILHHTWQDAAATPWA